MPDLDLTEAEIAEMFGGEAQPIETDPDEMAVATILARIRVLLHKAAEDGDVRVNQLAKRLNVSPSVVSRLLRSEGDMKVSTAVLWARALGKVWSFALEDMDSGAYGQNANVRNDIIARFGREATSVSVSDFEPARVTIAAPRALSVSVTGAST